MSLMNETARITDDHPLLRVDPESGHRLPRWVFLRLLGCVYFIAFTSLWSQIIGLIGADGIVPAQVVVADFANTLAMQPDSAWWFWPTLFQFLAPTDGIIHLVCLAGTVLSMGLILGFMPRVVIAGLWLMYLSLFTVCHPFMGYQWDILLLEVSVLAFFYAPGNVLPQLNSEREPSKAAVWLFRLLLFKLVISSGLVKLNSGDPTWQDLTALDYHFFTQPIPHQLSWYAHNLGSTFRQAGVFFNHFVELCVPWLILIPLSRYLLLPWLLLSGGILWSSAGSVTPSITLGIGGMTLAMALAHRITAKRYQWTFASGRMSRALAASLIVGLMLSVGLGGNYGFFNVLTIALVLPALDDRLVYRLTPTRFLPRLPSETGQGPRFYWAIIGVLALVTIGPLNGVRLLQVFGQPHIRAAAKINSVASATKTDTGEANAPSLWGQIGKVQSVVNKYTGSFALVNGYGLFARMTTERYELMVEGSQDGQDWQAYRFKYKPNDPTELHFAWLHMPRLDWQMWFAALYPKCSRKWFFGFMDALLDNAESVEGLLETNPFKKKPPKYIRVRRVRAHFTTSADGQDTSKKWHFEPVSDYCPIVSKKDLKEIVNRRIPKRRRPQP
jgi:hypothetical protein